jgi:hypothetical protein
VRAEPERENEQRREAGPIVATGSALLERLPPDVPPAARDRPAAALIPPFASDAIVWTTDSPSYLATQAIELLAWDGASPHRRHPRRLVTPQTTPALTDPAA